MLAGGLVLITWAFKQLQKVFTLFTINKNTAHCVLATQVLSAGATVMHLGPTRAMHSTGTAKHKDLANTALAAKRLARSTEQAITTERKLFHRLAPNFHFKIFNSRQDHYNLLVSINVDSVCAVGYNFSLQGGPRLVSPQPRHLVGVAGWRCSALPHFPAGQLTWDLVSELPSREVHDPLPIVRKPEKKWDVLGSDSFLKEVSEEECAIKPNRALPHITLQGGVSTKSLLGVPFLFPSSLEECGSRRHFVRLLWGARRGALCLSATCHTCSKQHPSTSLKGKTYREPDTWDGGAVHIKLHTKDR